MKIKNSLLIFISSLLLLSACNASKRCGCPTFGEYKGESNNTYCHIDRNSQDECAM